MQAHTLPSGLRTTRVIAYVQGALLLLTGGLLVFGGSAAATALDLRGSGSVALVVVIGLAVSLVAVLVIWAGVLLGRLSRRARYGLLVYEYLSVVFGLLTLSDLLQGGIRVLLAAVAIYYLQFDAATKTAFSAPPPPR